MSIGPDIHLKYCAWLVADLGFNEKNLTVIETHPFGDSYLSVKAVTFEDVEQDVCLSVPIPFPSIERWVAMQKHLLHAKRRTKRSFIVHKGITVHKTWAWSARREREVRADIDRLGQPWGWERLKLWHHPESLEEYARHPL